VHSSVNPTWNETLLVSDIYKVVLSVWKRNNQNIKEELIGEVANLKHEKGDKYESGEDITVKIKYTENKKGHGELVIASRAINTLDEPNELSYTVAKCETNIQTKLSSLRQKQNDYEKAAKTLFKTIVGKNKKKKIKLIGIMNGISFNNHNTNKSETSIVAKNTTVDFLKTLQTLTSENKAMPPFFIFSSEKYLNLSSRLNLEKHVTHGPRIGPLAVTNSINPRRPEDQWPTPGHIVNFLEYLFIDGSPTAAKLILERCDDMIVLQLNKWLSAQFEIRAYNEYFEIYDQGRISWELCKLKYHESLVALTAARDGLFEDYKTKRFAKYPETIVEPKEKEEFLKKVANEGLAGYDKIVKLTHASLTLEQQLTALEKKNESFSGRLMSRKALKQNKEEKKGESKGCERPHAWFSEKGMKNYDIFLQKIHNLKENDIGKNSIDAHAYTTEDADTIGIEERIENRGGVKAAFMTTVDKKYLVGRYELKGQFKNDVKKNNNLFANYAFVPFRSVRPYFEILVGKCGSKMITKDFLSWVWERYCLIFQNDYLQHLLNYEDVKQKDISMETKELKFYLNILKKFSHFALGNSNNQSKQPFDTHCKALFNGKNELKKMMKKKVVSACQEKRR
jgi:hypothetical protein